MASCNNNNNSNSSKKKSAVVLYSFLEARRMARGYGFDSKEEFLEYSCPGSYKLPKNPDEIWPDKWEGWEDFLGICYKFEIGRLIARKLQLKTKDEYLSLMKKMNNNNENKSSSSSSSFNKSNNNNNTNNKDPSSSKEDDISRLPFRPDLYYKLEWNGWDDWLGC